MTIEGFLNYFKQRHETMRESHPFCWILGSGASFQSGIPTGKDLAIRWLNELHKQNDPRRPIEEWATEKNLEIKGFDYSRAASFYPLIYHRRFHNFKEEGYAFLENVMDHAEPSFGYSVLAQIMATTPHKVVITTNFDNLVAKALSVYPRESPLICGHESLTGFIRPDRLRRPLIAKIHRDLLLAPLSDPDDIGKLSGEWATALAKIFDRFTPIVIGYGGNDGSLMGFLNKHSPIEGGVFWCYREGDEIDPAIAEVVEHHRGYLVPIAGFDEVMLLLQETMQLKPLRARGGWLRSFIAATLAFQPLASKSAANLVRQRPPRAALAPEPVGDAMMKIDFVTIFKMPAYRGAEAKITIRQLIDEGFEGDKAWLPKNRLPILDAKGRGKYVLHRSTVDALLAAKKRPPDVDESTLTLEDLREDNKLRAYIVNSFMVLSENATLTDAKDLLVKNPLCLDILVTQDGTKKGVVVGWLTNVMVLNAATVAVGLESAGHAMMRINYVTIFKMPAYSGAEAEITIKQLIDEGFERDKARLPRNRLPILDADQRGKYVLHRSTVDALLAAKKRPPDVDESTLTLKDLLVEPKLRDYFFKSFMVLSEAARLSDAKDLFDKNPRCLDILVTHDGTKKGVVVGWITNVMVLQAATI